MQCIFAVQCSDWIAVMYSKLSGKQSTREGIEFLVKCGLTPLLLLQSVLRMNTFIFSLKKVVVEVKPDIN